MLMFVVLMANQANLKLISHQANSLYEDGNSLQPLVKDEIKNTMYYILYSTC